MKLAPLYQLLQKDTKWTWGRKQNEAFKAAKSALQDDSLLVHYDESKPLVLACDASQYGLGAVLSHVIEDGKERPVAYASQTLTPAEKNYSQIEKEGLAIIFGVKNFTISSLVDISQSHPTINPCLTCSAKPKECPRQHHPGSRDGHLLWVLIITISATNQGLH